MTFDKYATARFGLDSSGLTPGQINETARIAIAQMSGFGLGAMIQDAADVSRASLLGGFSGNGALGTVISAAGEAKWGALSEFVDEAFSPMLDGVGIDYAEMFHDEEPVEPRSALFDIYDAPPMVPPLPESPEPCDHKGLTEAQEAEIRALRAEREKDKRTILHLRQRLDVPAFRNLVELTDPDVPPDDSRFCFD